MFFMVFHKVGTSFNVNILKMSQKEIQCVKSTLFHAPMPPPTPPKVLKPRCQRRREANWTFVAPPVF